MAGAVTTLKRALRAAEGSVRRGSDPVWRYVFNAGAVVEYRRRPPVLQPEGRRVAADLHRDGYAVTTLEALTGDPALLSQLQAEAGRRERERADKLAAQREHLAAGQVVAGYAKLFTVQLLDDRRPEIDPTGLLARVALHAQLRGVADTYFGLRTRVADLNIWRTLPSNQPPASSQLWHRDMPEDRRILKAFVYLEDVAAGGGPFSYAIGTHREHGRPAVPTEFDGMNQRVPERASAALLALERVATGPAGTLVLADTVGFHRGGFARDSARLLLQIRYASRAATDDRRLGAPPGLDRRAWRRDLAYGRPRRRG